MPVTNHMTNLTPEEELAALRQELAFEKGFSTAFSRGTDAFYELNVTKGVIISDLLLNTRDSRVDMIAYAGFAPGCRFEDLFSALADLCVEETYRYPFKRSLSQEFILQKYAENVHVLGFEYRRKSGVPGPLYLRHEVQLSLDPRSGDIIARGSVRNVSNRYAMKADSANTDETHEALLSSLGKIYYQIFYIYLVNDIFIPLETTDYVKEHLRMTFTASEAFATLAGSHEKSEYYDALREFQDLSTLQTRLAEKDYVSFDYDSSLGWARAAFLVSEREASGEVKSVIYTMQLIQEEKLRQLENERILAEALDQAQAASRAKTAFLNNMSHDIRTPMNAIIGYTGIAAGHIDDKERVRDCLTKISYSSNHLLALINDILDMSRIESGRVTLNNREESLSQILHTLHDITISGVKAKRQELYIDTLDVRDERILCDKLRLNQILLNILSNSIKYTQDGGTIAFKVTEKGVSETGYGKYEFVIKDNGMGMSGEFLKTIFDPFTRVNNSTISGIEGTGLGMAITKNIVDMMGGTIDIKSTEGKGTETTLTFDFKIADDSEKAPVRLEKVQGMKALVVDDDMTACTSVSSMLREIGMDSDWCVSGLEAVVRTEEALSRKLPFKVYIIDWQLPDLNGIETARRIRRIAGNDVPIIVLSAYDWSDIEEEAKEAGVTDFISKPIFMSDLTTLLSRHFGEHTEQEETEDIRFDGKKILLVEDNEMNREIAVEILEESGFMVDTAENGLIALEKVSRSTPEELDLILMDVQMPVMDGYEATRRIRALHNGMENTIILAMTANAFAEDRDLALQSGMNEHLTKPIEIDKLKATLAKFLNK